MLNSNMTRRSATMLVLAAQAALLTSMPAFAGEQDFTLHNKTGIEIHALYVAPHSSDDWGEDILGQKTLEPGKSIDIKFRRSEKAAHWDLRVEDEAGHSVSWSDINLKEIEEITIHYKDGKAWADFK